MKTMHDTHLKSEKGSALIAVLFFVIFLAAMAGSLLDIALQEFKLSKRSLAWNQAIYSAETGVEYGWNELNRLTGINTNGAFMAGWNGPYSNSTWTLSSTSLVALAGTDATSTLVATVITNSPAGGMTIMASGTASSPIMASTVTRNVKAVLDPVRAFNYAILCRNDINFNANSARVDSWNSNNGAYDGTHAYSNGHTDGYRAHGNVGTNGLVNNTGGLDLYGSPSTGPGGAWTGASPIQPVAPDTGTNYWTSDTRVSIPDASLPRSPAFSSSPTTYASTPAAITAAGDYVMPAIASGMTFGDASGAGGVIRVHVTGGIDLGGNNTISIIQPSSGATTYRVELYVDGPTIKFYGTEDCNATSDAKCSNLQIYGLPTCTSVIFSGNCETHAALYAPSANVEVNGGGNKAFYGSMVGKTFTAHGGIDIHYDEALGNQGLVTGYSLAQWIEY
ncbi:MAG: hypothetical protein PHV34_11185 [Verrucomicrobiae bacterium]|nr:hypothetical protein [Verrucomicrobiae bacterium]